jgi:vanillate O-demethylase monooxygenase subunit
MQPRYTAYDGYPDNQWWVAAASAEVGDKPLARLLLEQPVVIWRPGPGEVAVLEDRCSHRQIPLSFGVQVGRALQCNYHGLRFGRDGRCVLAPGMKAPTPAMNIQSYPAVERDGYVWVWFGSKAPDHSLIPDYSWQVSGEYSGKIGYASIGCSYLLGLENVLDTSHFAFLHPNSVGSAAYADTPMATWIEGPEVVSRRRVENLAPSLLFNKLTQSPTVTLTDEMRWRGPSYMWLTTTVEAPDGVFRMRGLAPYTPERRDSHHHWFSHFCDFPLSDEQQGIITKVAGMAIEEDRVVLVANQQRIDSGYAREPVMLPGDKAAVRMRMLNRELIETAGLYDPAKAWRPEPAREPALTGAI